MAERGVRARRLLAVNAATLLAVLATYPAFKLAGMWSSVTLAYAAITVGLFAACSLSVVMARTISPLVGLVFYAWAGWGAVAGMVWLDIGNGGRDFPAVFYLLHGGVLCLGRLGQREQAMVYAIASVAVMLAAAMVYRQWDQATACILSAIIVAIAGGHNGRE